MKDEHIRFLSALRAALNNQTVSWESVSPADWRALFQLAQQHKVGPMIYVGGISLPCGKAGAGTDAGVEAADHAASAGANAKDNGISAPICSAA